MKVLDLFAGIGGFSLAAHWMGWQTVAFVEKEPFCHKVLRKNFGQEIEIHDDIFNFDGRSLRGAVDIITGGFPCQPFSAAGKRKGRNDERHLFPQMLRVISEVRPRWVVAENVRGLLSIESGRVFAEVITSLESEGYEVITFCVPASALNAPHRRDRLWIVAHAIESGAGSESGSVTDERRQSCESRGEGIRQRNGAISSSGINATDSNASHSDNSGSRASQSEVIAKRPPFSGERQQSQLELSGHGETAANTGHEYESWHSERLEACATEWATSDLYPERCSSESQDENRDTANGNDEGLQRGDKGTNSSREPQAGIGLRNRNAWQEPWLDVAARTCVRGVDAGLPNGLDIIGKRDHRTARLKALGNSIVPQIAHEIFKAIEAADNI